VTRALECALLFFVFPPLLFLVRHHLAFRIVPLVLALAALSAACLWRDPTFPRARLGSARGARPAVFALLAFFVPAGLVVGALTAIFAPEQFLRFPWSRPCTWLAVMLLYPPLVALPQEVLFRAFFFHRYGPLLSHRLALLGTNALSFGLAHLVYGNWVAVGLSTLGGGLFAYRYLRTGSLLVVALEHGLWGNLLFTIGAGWYLYSGSIR
jgi:membrane protease YdiL (CAAX protease family)